MGYIIIIAQVARDLWLSGADPEIEEGGGIHIKWDWCGARRTQLSVRALASFNSPAFAHSLLAIRRFTSLAVRRSKA